MALEESLDWIATESDLDEVEDQIQNVKKFIVDHSDNQDAFYSVDELIEAIVQRNPEQIDGAARPGFSRIFNLGFT